MLKHTIELKLPKFLGSMFEKYTPEEKAKLGKTAKVIGTALLGVTVVYLTGYNRGLKRATDNRGIYIIRSGGK